MRQWRVIYDQPASELGEAGVTPGAGLPGAINMAIDEALLEAVTSGESPPTLRVYAWSPPCLSLGYGQNTKDADLERIAAQGWHIVRRPTGGKAILHTDELTYSLTLPPGDPTAAGEIVESYRQISVALIAALQRLGLTPQSERRAEGLPKDSGAVCFEVPSHYEITVGGRKLVGSAQMRRQGGLLQHGTLPLTGDLARICDALDYPDEFTRQQAKGEVRARAVTLSEALGQRITWAVAAQALIAAFEQVFEVDFSAYPGELTAAERAHAEHLAAGRYASLDRVRMRR